MKKDLKYLLFITVVLAMTLSACGSSYKYEICPAESGFIGPCNSLPMSMTLTGGKPSEGFTLEGNFQEALVSVAGVGWIDMTCSPLVTTREPGLNTTFSAYSPASQGTQNCTVSAKTWPTYNGVDKKVINVQVTFYGQ
jgi:hypothetical protein